MLVATAPNQPGRSFIEQMNYDILSQFLGYLEENDVKKIPGAFQNKEQAVWMHFKFLTQRQGKTPVTLDEYANFQSYLQQHPGFTSGRDLIPQVQRLHSYLLIPQPAQIALVVANLRSLKELALTSITERNTTEMLCNSLTGFPQLETLDLSGCRVYVKDFKKIAACEKLKRLHLALCTMALGPGLSCLSKLEYLNLQNCSELKDSTLAVLQTFKNLRALDISGCGKKITSAGWRCLGGFPALTGLNISGSEIANQDLVHLEKLELTRLNLTNCSRIVEVDHFLTNVQSINLLFIIRCTRNPESVQKAGCTIVTSDAAVSKGVMKKLFNR